MHRLIWVRWAHISVCRFCVSFVFNFIIIWATSWQNQQRGCAPSEDSDQPEHPPNLIRVFAVRSMVAKDPSFLHVYSADWSHWADAQADLSFRWTHSHFVGFVMRRLKFCDCVIFLCLFQIYLPHSYEPLDLLPSSQAFHECSAEILSNPS